MKGEIRLKSLDDIRRIRDCGLIIHEIFSKIDNLDLVGMSTWELDTFVEDFIKKKGSRPAFKTVRGYNYSTCISVNHVASHGIPSKKIIIKNGDIVKIDTGTVMNGYFADSCTTFIIGEIPKQSVRLVNSALQAMIRGIEKFVPGNYTGDAGFAIQSFVEEQGYSIVKNFTGHGVGFALHEPPVMPNFGREGQGILFREGMVVTCEPIVNEGVGQLIINDDGWTSETADGKLSAQFEHTVAITGKGPLLLTAP